MGKAKGLERRLRGRAVRDGWLRTVPVSGRNGETWHVPGVPMDPEQAAAVYRAVDALDEAEREGASTRATMGAAFEAAYRILRTAYPRLSRRAAHRHVLDPRAAAGVVHAAVCGEAAPEGREAELARVERAVVWCMAHKEVANTPARIAAIIVDGVPEPEEDADRPKA